MPHARRPAGSLLVVACLLSAGVRAQVATRPTLDIRWPDGLGFDPQKDKLLFHDPQRIAASLPDWSMATRSGIGAPISEVHRWQMATVIVRSATGFGSGVVVTTDRWILTNYHVVAQAAQRAALRAETAVYEILTCDASSGRLRRRAESFRAELWRADPRHDLALLRIVQPPTWLADVPYLELAREPARETQRVFAIGSQANGVAWSVKSGHVQSAFEFPDGMTNPVVGIDSSTMTAPAISRTRCQALATDCTIAPGDSGGPLLNRAGQIVGLTFATPGNASIGSIGIHVGLEALQAILTRPPEQAEGVPFDVWGLGLPGVGWTTPQHDVLDDGSDRLLYRLVDLERSKAVAFAMYIRSAKKRTLVAVDTSIPPSTPTPPETDAQKHVPRGLWGMEDSGGFEFDVMFGMRTDGCMVTGQRSSSGVLETLAVDADGDQQTDVVWQRNAAGRWHAQRPDQARSLFDVLEAEQVTRLKKACAAIEAVAGR